MNRRRLRIEQWRDAILQITGNIDDQIGGTSFDVSKTESNRRTVYAHISRLELDGLLHLFDHPDPNVHAARRSETTTPLQKLFVLNSDFMIANAKRLATRLNQEIPDNLPARIDRAFEVVFGRTATADEMVMAESFVADESNWTQFTQILLASNELLFLD